MKTIDDNTLAAYLEGTLPDEEREWAEQAIEEDDELKAVVDEWISMADDLYAGTQQKINNDRELRMEACKSIGTVMEQVKSVSGYYTPSKQKWPIYRKILVAASLLSFVSVTGIWLFRSPSDSIQPIGAIQSAPSFDVPMGGDNMSWTTEDTTIVDTNLHSQ